MNKFNYDELVMLSVRIGNSFKGIRKFALVFENDQVIIKDNSSIKKIEDSTITDSIIINKLRSDISQINIEKWDTEYAPTISVIDPDYWEVMVVFSKDKIKYLYTGCENYPDNFKDLLNICKEYTNIFDRSCL